MVSMIEDIRVIHTASIEEEEAKQYVADAIAKYGKGIAQIELTLSAEEPDTVGVNVIMKKVPFERIRRITGYLVGTLDRWNSAKQAEESERVKHI